MKVVRCSAFMIHVVGACRTLYRNKKESEIEYELSEFMKHAPHRPGGAKFKVTAKTHCHFLFKKLINSSNFLHYVSYNIVSDFL